MDDDAPRTSAAAECCQYFFLWVNELTELRFN